MGARDVGAVATYVAVTLAVLLLLATVVRRLTWRRVAGCVFDDAASSGAVRGRVRFEALGEYTVAHFALRNLTPGEHGVHVHASGDVREGCAATCSHYNPTGDAHGGPLGAPRHRGDFGNLIADAAGRCEQSIVADVRLPEIVGRAFVVHGARDDLGRGAGDSRQTGNSGARVACAVIR